MEQQLKQWGIEAAALSPFVVTFTAILLQGINPTSRYKPMIAMSVGMLLGLGANAIMGLSLTDGVGIGFIAGLVAAASYLAGKLIERGNNAQ